MFHWLRRHSPASHFPIPIAERFQSGLLAQREQTDARIFWVLVAQWAVILVSSITMAARWKDVQVEVLSFAVIWVGVLTILPLTMVVRVPGCWQARWTVAISQGATSSLLWAVSGGSSETHLHLFAWLVVMALYRDAPVLLATVGTAAIGHLLVWGNCDLSNLPMNAVHLVWLAWLIGEASFLGVFVRLDHQALDAQVSRELAMETLQVAFHEKVDETTRKLADERDSLKGEVASLKERRATLEATRFEASRELNSLRRDVAAQATAVLKLASRPANATLPNDWRTHWQAIRQQAQLLMGLVDLTSTSVECAAVATDSSQSELAEAELEPSWNSPTERRALLLMRNPLQQAKTVAALESEGFKVDVAPNGPRTYYSVMLNDYAVILVDIDLPGEEGFDTLEALRLLPVDRVGQSNSLFAITCKLTPERVLRCTALGVDGMFEKPLNADKLRQSLAGANPPKIVRDDSMVLRRSGSRS